MPVYMGEQGCSNSTCSKHVHFGFSESEKRNYQLLNEAIFKHIATSHSDLYSGIGYLNRLRPFAGLVWRIINGDNYSLPKDDLYCCDKDFRFFTDDETGALVSLIEQGIVYASSWKDAISTGDSCNINRLLVDKQLTEASVCHSLPRSLPYFGIGGTITGGDGINAERPEAVFIAQNSRDCALERLTTCIEEKEKLEETEIELRKRVEEQCSKIKAMEMEIASLRVELQIMTAMSGKGVRY
ncbi:hypothetical protein BJ508DRAFT_313963 [Ascobolus immersus RN42]|uniref:Uncharacterized protein n=1 Tax=Ascobolus immersus RN42 TaxID=1160509 RepID=A0A3N4HL65_ASCIM|nr:hypothetical protein BJ508DRAFT_313963 [Ascobolus immersus RN42]